MQTSTLPTDSKNEDVPHVKDISYGPHERNVFDLWLAKSDIPTPLLIYFHGGGFLHGDKSDYKKKLLYRCLAHGISFASANYRFSQNAIYPASMQDGARAVQFIRHRAHEWNLDPNRFAAAGESSGSGISQWIGFHQDMADLMAIDPVERMSTRLKAVIAIQMQCSYDPRFIKKIVPGKAYNNKALKLLHGLAESWDWDQDPIDENLDAKLKDCSSISHLTMNAPPVFILHREYSNKEGNIHHSNFGKYLHQEMTRLGIECIRHMDTDYEDAYKMYASMVEFLKKHL